MKKYNSGQSLVEVVIAISVIAIGILAIAKVATKSISNTTFARNKALATRYAQDTIEKIRQYRDKNNWEKFTDYCDSASVMGLSEVLTPFTRTFTCLGSGDSREITVKILWSDAGGSHQTQIQTNLTAWK